MRSALVRLSPASQVGWATLTHYSSVQHKHRLTAHNWIGEELIWRKLPHSTSPSAPSCLPWLLSVLLERNRPAPQASTGIDFSTEEREKMEMEWRKRTNEHGDRYLIKNITTKHTMRVCVCMWGGGGRREGGRGRGANNILQLKKVVSWNTWVVHLLWN